MSEPRKKMKTAVLYPVLVRDNSLDVSIHRCPKRIVSEMQRIFGTELDMTKMYMIPLFRRTTANLVGIGADVEAEKNAQLDAFFAEAEQFVNHLAQQGVWADYTDPASGFPMKSERRAGTYPDVLGAQMLLKMDVMAANCCSILSHPKFGTNVYPCTMFAVVDDPQTILNALTTVYPELSEAELVKPVDDE
eukprot:TRINITY_DN21948_c0_g1_i1.p1 TRINITY_DN21948_c0_g1~~TRINITY_DN21948_c0_g1_i1.p1  ORF type:complete len:191 (+),score=35.15 TRINITY_DN21948_c0_g1_i1:75-647(+)